MAATRVGRRARAAMQGKPGPSNTRRGSEKKKVNLYNQVQVYIIILLKAMYNHLTHFECHDFVDI